MVLLQKLLTLLTLFLSCSKAIIETLFSVILLQYSIYCFQVLPQLTQIQNEVSQTVLDMCKTQKTYNIDESQAFDARAKAKEAEEK